MRVLEVSSFFEKLGGAEIYLHKLCRGLRDRGHAVALFAGSDSEERAEQLLRVVRRRPFDPRHRIRDAALDDEFLDFAQRVRPDVVHAHNLHALPAAFVRTLASTGAPLVFGPHDFSPFCPNSWLVWPDGTSCPGGPGKKCFEHGCQACAPYDALMVMASHLRLRLLREYVRACICGSDYLSEKCREHGLAGARTVRYFTDADDFCGHEALERKLQGVKREPDRILYCGRLSAEKGLSTLVEAMPLVLKERPKAQLSLLGSGPEEKALRRRVGELGITDSVSFHGHVPHEDVMDHIARATVQVLPSIWSENAAQSIYDCLLARTPMVASRIAALPEVVREGRNGLLFEPRDSSDLAAKVLEILLSPERAAAMQAACVAELERYDKERHLDEVEATFAEAVKAGAVHRPEADDDLAAIFEGVNGHCGRSDRGWARWKLHRALDKALNLVLPGV